MYITFDEGSLGEFIQFSLNTIKQILTILTAVTNDCLTDCLFVCQANERHMRTLAVEPPPMLDKEERRVKFINRNGNFVLIIVPTECL